nr:MAG TPA: Protein of unknown function (DUF4257) [Bacteriophage sp.]
MPVSSYYLELFQVVRAFYFGFLGDVLHVRH